MTSVTQHYPYWYDYGIHNLWWHILVNVYELYLMVSTASLTLSIGQLTNTTPVQASERITRLLQHPLPSGHWYLIMSVLYYLFETVYYNY